MIWIRFDIRNSTSNSQGVIRVRLPINLGTTYDRRACSREGDQSARESCWDEQKHCAMYVEKCLLKWQWINTLNSRVRILEGNDSACMKLQAFSLYIGIRHRGGLFIRSCMTRRPYGSQRSEPSPNVGDLTLNVSKPRYHWRLSMCVMQGKSLVASSIIFHVLWDEARGVNFVLFSRGSACIRQ